jgi:1-deoxy-D-xylulose-5-phosphate synthase
MNNAGIMKKDMIVVLNDNNMSIAPNVWAISNYFTELIADPRYNRLKKNVYELTGKLDHWGDRIRKAAARLEGGIKVVITPGMLFEALGFRYFGPINATTWRSWFGSFRVKELSGLILVHTLTEKERIQAGRGRRTALARRHSFDKVTASPRRKPPGHQRIRKSLERRFSLHGRHRIWLPHGCHARRDRSGSAPA